MSRAVVAKVLAESGNDSARPYAPSFIDRVTDWVGALPVPAWLSYSAAALIAVLVHASIKWLDGSFPAGTFVWRLALGDISFIYSVALLHFLDSSAREALDDFRPVMQINDAAFTNLRYRFTTLPVRPTLIAAFIGALYGSYSWLALGAVEVEDGRFFSSAPATVIEGIFFVSTYLGAGVIIYHSVRQLRMVSLIYTTHAQVDLFNLAPIYALSALAGRTAIGILLITYAWFFVNLPVDPGFSISIDIVILNAISVLTFVLPLLGAHKLLVRAKTKAQTEAQQQLKATIEELHRRREAGQFEEMAGVTQAIEGLVKEQSVLDKISVWPWKPETLRGVATAVLLPIILWAITRVLDRFWAL